MSNYPPSSALLRRAIDLAAANVSNDSGGPFGAVVARGSDVIAEGVNLVTSTNDPTAHAEIVAIRAACRALSSFQLNGCDIYASCEPCPMCLAAIYWARADRVFYAATKEDAARAGFDDSLIYTEIPLPPDTRRIPCVHLALDAAAQPFELWQSSQGRIAY